MFVIIGGAIAGLITLMGAAAYKEYRLWNKGICRDTGKPWVRFDVDSQGGRGYKSENHTLWISYPYIDGEYDESRTD